MYACKFLATNLVCISHVVIDMYKKSGIGIVVRFTISCSEGYQQSWEKYRFGEKCGIVVMVNLGVRDGFVIPCNNL